MAQIDVSDLLLDPDFVDPMIVIRRTATTNSFGQIQIVETQFSTYGSIQPASAKEVARLPEDVQLSDIRSFFLVMELLQAQGSAYPDVILYQGNRYQIKLAEPWINFGTGWNRGLAIKETVGL